MDGRWAAILGSAVAVMMLTPVGQAQDSERSKTGVDTRPGVTVYLQNATQLNDANEITTALRNMMDPTMKIYMVANQHAILMRGTPEQLKYAGEVVKDLDKPRAEYVMDVAVLEVSKEKLRQQGVKSGSGLSEAAVGQLMNDKETHVVQSQRLRSTDGQRATLKIGSKIPVATGASAANASTTGPQTAFQYLDVGVNIDLTPALCDGHEVCVRVKLEDSMQSGAATISGVTEPIIRQSVVEQVVQLRDGEATVVAASSKEDGTSEIVFLLTPHVVAPK